MNTLTTMPGTYVPAPTPSISRNGQGGTRAATSPPTGTAQVGFAFTGRHL